MITVTVCVGSSCHIKGARVVITRFSELLKENDLEKEVELKGSFCMDRCGEGINWQINNDYYTSETADDAVEMFKARVVRKDS